MEKWIQISSDYFCAAVAIENGKVKQAAPILTYMNGWDLEKVQRHCQEKKWTTYLLNELLEKEKRYVKRAS